MRASASSTGSSSGSCRLNPLIVTLAVGQIVAAYSLRYSRENTNSLSVPPALSSWAADKPLGISSVFWTGAGITLALALLLRYTTAGRRFQAAGANPRAAWMAGLHVRTHIVFAYAAAGTLYAMAAILLAGIRINIDPAFGAGYLLAPIAAVVIAGAALSGGLASSTSTWVAALALTLLTQMLLILGLSTALQFIAFGARDHRRNAGLRRPGSSAARPRAAAGRTIQRATRNGQQPELRLERRKRCTYGRRCEGGARSWWCSCSRCSSLHWRSSRPAAAVRARSTRRRCSSARAADSARCTRRDKPPSRRRSSTPRSSRRTRSRAASRWRVSAAPTRRSIYDLALKCWKNNGCNTGTGGKLTVAYIEQFGENVYRQMSKMEFILQALTYPQVGKIIYTSAHSDLNQGIADFKAAIAQKVSLIVSYPDFGDAMLPVMKEATDAGIPVATYAWGYVTGPGKNYLTVVGEFTCNLGKAFAAAMNKQVGSGDIAFLGGFPGNPLSLGWQTCEKPALNSNIDVVATEPTNWDPSKVQSVVAGILAAHPDIKGWSYEYGGGMALGALAAYKAAGKPFNPVLTLRTDDVRMGCEYNAAQEDQPGPQDVLLHLGQLADPGGLHGRDDEAEGREDPAHDRVPGPVAGSGQARLVHQGLSAGCLGDVTDPAEPAAPDVPVGGSERRT